MQSFAILIDYENFTCPPKGLQDFIADFSKRGTIIVKRAYADWVKCAPHRHQLLANQVEMIELACTSKGKNSVDIRLVVDAMELVFTKPYIDCFVIASADADYLPLLSRLREYNKRTIVVSGKANTHRYMQTHCDEFVNGDVYLTPGRKATKITTSPRTESQKLAPPKTTLHTTTPPKTTPARSQIPTPDQLHVIQSLLTMAWQTHGFDKPFNLSRLGALLKTINSGLEWKEYGFKSLKAVVAQMVTTGFLRIELTSGSDERIFFVTHESQTAPDSETGNGNGTAAVSLAPCSNHEVDNGSDRERELVSMVQSLVNESIRWDNLRTLLLQKRPNPFSELQSEDAFMKLLQSMETGGLIELRYDAIQRTYYVARPREVQPSTNSRGEADAINVIALEVNAETQTTVWTQPGLF